MSLNENEPNRTSSDPNQSSSGVAKSDGSAAHASAAAPGESSHEVIVWNVPGDYAGNEEKHELECGTCGVIGAIADHELALKVAALHTDFLGPLRDMAEVE